MDSPSEVDRRGGSTGASASAAEPDVVFEARIDTAEDVGDGITRLSGVLVSGGRFVLVPDERSLARP